MKDQIPTVRSRQLGVELRSIRRRAGYSGIELARVLGWSSSRVSRLESGKRGVSEVHVAAWLGVCRVTGREFDEVIGLCRGARHRHWLQSHDPMAHDTVRTLIHLETTAARISEYEPLVVPGLLQTEDYARALYEPSGLISAEEMDRRVRARLARQAIFRLRQAPTCRFYVSEHVLGQPVGNSLVMNEQLQHMVLVAALPQCSIRIVPADGSAPFRSFRLMEFAEHPPCVYLRHVTGSLFLEESEIIDTYRAYLARLYDTALDPQESRETLQTWASRYDMQARAGITA